MIGRGGRSSGNAARVPGARPGRITVQGWFSLGLGLVVVLITLAAVMGWRSVDTTGQAYDRLAEHIAPAQTAALDLKTALVDQETGVRGYAITGDSRFLQPYTDGLTEERTAVARLRRLLGPAQERRARVSLVERRALAWRQQYAEPLVSRVHGGPVGTPGQALAERGKASFDRVRAALDEQERTLAAAHRAASETVADRREQRNAVFLSIVIIVVVVCAALALLVRLAVVRPLNRLGAAARRVAANDFEHRIASGGPADLALLAEDVEAMRRRIASELSTALRAQRELRAKSEELTRQSEELSAQAAELRRSNSELEQFAYVASHDLQEPLRKVASFCQLLEKRYADVLDDRGRQYIGFAVDGAKRMQVLINDLLTFSRVGRLHDRREPVGLDGVLDRALGNLETALEQADAVVERGGEPLPTVLGDPTLLTMLWQNLVGNAVKFRVPGRSPVVRIACTPVTSGPDDGCWEFTVSDNGIGIQEQYAEKIFVIFQRLHHRDAYGGTGIGLALCRKIVEHHGGRIELDTAYTGGARIRFTLPVHEDETPAPESEQEPAPGPKRAPGSAPGHGRAVAGPAHAGAPGTPPATPAVPAAPEGPPAPEGLADPPSTMSEKFPAAAQPATGVGAAAGPVTDEGAQP